MTRASLSSITRLLPTLLLASACQSGQVKPPAPPPTTHRAQISNDFTASAQVTALTPAERRLTVRREDGTLLDLQVGAEVRNYEQIAVGDTLRVHYKETLVAEKLPPGEAAKPAEAALAAARAKPGAKPLAGVGMGISLRVKIESIDREHEIVVFALASGELIAHRLQTDEGRAFVQELAVGDTVQLDYAKALAIGVEKL